MRFIIRLDWDRYFAHDTVIQPLHHKQNSVECGREQNEFSPNWNCDVKSFLKRCWRLLMLIKQQERIDRSIITETLDCESYDQTYCYHILWIHSNQMQMFPDISVNCTLGYFQTLYVGMKNRFAAYVLPQQMVVQARWRGICIFCRKGINNVYLTTVDWRQRLILTRAPSRFVAPKWKCCNFGEMFVIGGNTQFDKFKCSQVMKNFVIMTFLFRCTARPILSLTLIAHREAETRVVLVSSRYTLCSVLNLLSPHRI